MSINYPTASDTENFNFDPGRYFDLIIDMFNCQWSSSSWVSNVGAMQDTIRTAFDGITNLTFRGVGVNMPRGTINNLFIGVSASYWSGNNDLDQSDAVALRQQVVTTINNISELTVTETRMSITLIQWSSY